MSTQGKLLAATGGPIRAIETIKAGNLEGQVHLRWTGLQATLLSERQVIGVRSLVTSTIPTLLDRRMNVILPQGSTVLPAVLDGGSNRPLSLNDPAIAWVLQSGYADVFCVEAGLRHHLFRAEPGVWLFGAMLAGGRMLIAVGSLGSQFRRESILAALEEALPVERWVQLLTEAMAGADRAWPDLILGQERQRVEACQTAWKRNPLSAPNLDPLLVRLVPVIHRRDPRAADRIREVNVGMSQAMLRLGGVAARGGASAPLPSDPALAALTILCRTHVVRSPRRVLSDRRDISSIPVRPYQNVAGLAPQS